jgi:hypothetical protein
MKYFGKFKYPDSLLVGLAKHPTLNAEDYDEEVKEHNRRMNPDADMKALPMHANQSKKNISSQKDLTTNQRQLCEMFKDVKVGVAASINVDMDLVFTITSPI